MTRRPIVTAYRQSALICAAHLAANGPTKAALVKRATGIDNAARIMQRDVYGLFERVDRGVYAISPKGEAALTTFADAIPTGSRTAVVSPETPRSAGHA